MCNSSLFYFYPRQYGKVENFNFPIPSIFSIPHFFFQASGTA